MRRLDFEEGRFWQEHEELIYFNHFLQRSFDPVLFQLFIKIKKNKIKTKKNRFIL